jgi:ABC-type sugar transport system substrate-binding protein
MSRRTWPLVIALGLLLGCQPSAPPPAAAPKPVPAPPTAAAPKDATPAAPVYPTTTTTVKRERVKKPSFVFGVCLPAGDAAKLVAEGMKSVAGANSVELKMADPEGDAVKQGQQVRDFVAAKVDAILVVPAGPELSAALPAALREHLPVIVCGGKVDGAEITVARGSDLAALTEAERKELGRVAVETGFAYLHGDPVPTNRALALNGG